jgi:crotonobetaine/carnitine-CoA ligase
MLRFLEGPERTVPALLARGAERNGNRVALRLGDETLSFEGAFDAARRLASGLYELGVRQGDHVAVLLENSLDFHRAWFGINQLGAVEVPINTAYRGDGLAYILEHSQARYLIVEDALVDRVAEIAADMGELRHLIVRGDADAAGFEVHTLGDVLGSDPDGAPAPTVTPADPAAVMYTSGTTGPPKGVVLPHGCPISWAEQTAERLALVPGETHYCSFPLFHALAQYFATMPVFGNDGCTAIAPRFSASGFWGDVRRYNATSANMMGAVVSFVFSQPEREDDADNPLRLAFGAPVPASIIKDFERRFALRFVEIYGSSEANVPLWNPLDDVRPGSCGKPIGRFDVRLVDELDADVAPGEVGEIAVRPHEPFSMMSEYYRQPDATANAFRNLWFHTGDLARRDSEGYYYFVDRAKDSIRRRGENISSWEIETVLAKHADVADCAAFAVPSALTEDDVMVTVVAKPGHELDVEELLRFCADRMPPYMVPRYVDVIAELPRTPTGKIEKFRLRERGPSEKTWDRERAAIGGTV